MQKLLRRVATAERAAAKRAKTRDTRAFKRAKMDRSSEQKDQLSMANSDFQRAKQVVKDEWNLGPLAPRQDVGGAAEGKGAIHMARYSSYGRLTLVMRNRRCQWAGGAYNLNLAVGDRVVLLDGPDKGRIGNLKSIDHDRAEVIVDKLNMSNVQIVAEFVPKGQPSIVNFEIPIPISSIRLVHPIKDATTGVTRDVIINQLVHGGFLHDRLTGKRRWSRIVPGLNISIPWPKKEKPDIKDYPCDTLRIDVEEKTFVPTLLQPPMPESIINELRGRYSRFRTRHEPEYIARLEAEERAKDDRKKLMESVRTPLQELHRAEREKKKKKGKPRLSIEMLEKIGEVMARNMERTRNAHALPDTPDSSSSVTPSAGEASIPTPSESTEETIPPPST
ncbi:hypothetical protein F4677DRAFT_428115 [Hypoxylon crocopeplum]|nr:hypothetical protein F4677DRAFT_428115 [Hypoxylon crocopeplum]